MKNLIIIGNGFDKAHNLKTTYNEFIENLLTHYFSTPDKYPNIFYSLPQNVKNYDELKSFIAKNPTSDFTSQVHGKVNYKNKLIGSLLNDFVVHKWCDIEYKYFTELMNCTEFNNSKRLYANPKKLNDDFDEIKKYLSMYLIEKEKQAKKLISYENLFKQFADSNTTLILNFNYTRIIDNLYKDVIKCPVIYIHGKLEDENNPMIFGYAANNEQIRKLNGYNDNEYLKNIKKNLYNGTNNKKTLNDFLEIKNIFTDKMNVFIFGHSCGLSDNLILHEIFSNKNISSIRIFFYEERKQYLDVQANINRIMGDSINSEKLETFPDSNRMPQWNDNNAQIQEFIDYLILK
jgi:hypothetical protein